MNNRVLRALLLGAAIGGLVIGAAPAQAAGVSWDDPKDDVKMLGNGPNDAAFDITKVAIANDGGNLKWEVAVPGVVAGRPTVSTGYTFRFLFTQGDVDFQFQVAENLLGESVFSVRQAGGTPPYAPLPCDKCEGKIDREGKKVVVTAPLAALGKALQSVEGAGALAGTEWSALSVLANRPFGIPNPGGALPVTGVVTTEDTAAAPEGTTLKF